MKCNECRNIGERFSVWNEFDWELDNGNEQFDVATISEENAVHINFG